MFCIDSLLNRQLRDGAIPEQRAHLFQTFPDRQLIEDYKCDVQYVTFLYNILIHLQTTNAVKASDSPANARREGSIRKRSGSSICMFHELILRGGSQEPDRNQT